MLVLTLVVVVVVVVMPSVGRAKGGTQVRNKENPEQQRCGEGRESGRVNIYFSPVAPSAFRLGRFSPPSNFCAGRQFRRLTTIELAKFRQRRERAGGLNTAS